MTLLFLKTKVKKYCLLGAILYSCSVAIAGDTIPDLLFKEHCKASNAYMEYYYTDVSYTKSWTSYKRQTSIQSKLILNSRAGVEEFAFLNLSRYIIDHLRTFQIKTLKADGTVVELDSSLVFKHQTNDEQLEQIIYPIPGVEPGDTIEISYIYMETLNDNELGDFVNLYSQIPSYKTEFSITSSPDLLVRYKTYNGFPEPQVFSNDSLIYCLFKMEKINGLTENQYTCTACELPYVYYSLDKKENEVITWKNVYNRDFNFITQPILMDFENSPYFGRWKKRVIGEAGDSSKYYKLNLLLDDIYKNYQIEPAKEDEAIKSSGYYLKEMRFDPISIRRLFRQLLEDLEIDYWAVFARSKRLGNIDPYYIRNGEYDHVFFAFENSKGSLSFLYPHSTSYKFQINEIPTSLYNTEAVIVKPFLHEKIKSSDKFINYDLKVAEVDSVTVDIIKLPGMGVNFNYIKQVFYCDVDVYNKNTSFTSNFSVSGGLSTDIRSFFGLLNQNKEMNEFYEALAEFEGDKTSLKIDTITNTDLKYTKPFVFSIRAQGKLKENLFFINDSIISVTLDNLIQHNQIQSDADSINLNYYLDYCYTDICTIILKFPCDIELLGFEGINRDFKNVLGAYSINLNVANNNQLMIQSNYKIIKDMIPKEDYDQIKQMNEFVQEIKNMRLLIKLKAL